MDFGDKPKWQIFIIQNIVFKLLDILGFAQNSNIGGIKNAQCILGKVGRDGQLLGAPKNKTIGLLTDQTNMHEDFTNASYIQLIYSLANKL